MLARAMQLAEYFCTGYEEDQEDWRHFALNAPYYTHFTSPIRRYADVVVHRQLTAVLAGTDVAYTRDEVDRIADNCNLRKLCTLLLHRCRARISTPSPPWHPPPTPVECGVVAGCNFHA